MRRAIYLAIILTSSLSVPALAQVSATVSTDVGTISATVSPTFLAPVETVNATTFLSPAAVTTYSTTVQANAPNPTVTATGQEGAATNSFAGTPFQAASQGSEGNTSYATGEGPQGEHPVQNLADRTTKQLTNLRLPMTGTRGLAPVFGQ
jgi:hypothetical protein